jgi:hypothetical protein
VDRSLRRAVLERLAAVEELAACRGTPLSVRAARIQLKSITGGWRELLLEHQPDAKGRCPVCSGWLRRRRWPCQVWVTAHEHLLGEWPAPARSATTSSPFHRPRRVDVIPRQVAVSEAADQAVTGPPADPGRRAAGPGGPGLDGRDPIGGAARP